MKPQADSIARSKKIWERLRRKSHVPKDERKALVAELFGIITGKVKDFVFKHDSVRVIQTAIKYAQPAQRRQIAKELQGEYCALAESRYAKFLIAKLMVDDAEIRDLVVPEFYGHVKRLIRHGEAAWLLDDIYRTVATNEQKTRLLREWYGHEFAIFQDPKGVTSTADLRNIISAQPEKRGPIMQHLKVMTNQLMQKKTTGFTMLHDALLQYFLNCAPGSSDALELIQALRDDEDGDCLKNLAFTPSGARLVCLVLAYGTAKDRRAILKVYKGVIRMLAGDVHGHSVVLTSFDVIDDTVMTAKVLLPELLCNDLEGEQRWSELLSLFGHLIARIPLLYLLSSRPPKWLLSHKDTEVLNEVHEISKSTSKKEPNLRRQELVKAVSTPLLESVAKLTEALVSSSFGCQFITEVLFGTEGHKTTALEQLAALAGEKPETMDSPHAGRMLKSLVQGGPFDKEKKEVRAVEPRLGFENILYSKLKGRLADWASSPNSFVVVAMLESPCLGGREDFVKELWKSLPRLKDAAHPPDKEKVNAGTVILLQELECPEAQTKND